MRRMALAGCTGIQAAVKGFSTDPFAGVGLRMMSMSARSAAGTWRWPG
jgi:hypothetical protein